MLMPSSTAVRALGRTHTEINPCAQLLGVLITGAVALAAGFLGFHAGVAHGIGAAAHRRQLDDGRAVASGHGPMARPRSLDAADGLAAGADAPATSGSPRPTAACTRRTPRPLRPARPAPAILGRPTGATTTPSAASSPAYAGRVSSPGVPPSRSPMRTILVVEDEPQIAGLVRDYLEHAGFAVITAGDGPAALALARTRRPDAIVLDLGLPRVDGLDVIRAIRRDSRVPIVILTARGDETDRVTGLELGADDYVVKPFSPRELVARVRAVLRRAEAVAPRRRADRGRRPGAGPRPPPGDRGRPRGRP